MSRRFGLLLVAGALAFSAAPARADHIPGATYTGTAATGGTIEVDVSADGASVTRFAASQVPTDCGVVSVSFTGSIPIVNHAFAREAIDGADFAGTFAPAQRVAGTLSEGAGGAPVDCAYSVGWTGATTALPPQPPAVDRSPPTIDVRAGRRIRPGGVIPVRVRCRTEPCQATVAGTISVRGDGGGRFRLESASAPLAQGDRTRLAPALGRRALAAARRALRAGRRVKARLKVTAVDSAGNRTVKRRSVRLLR